MKEVILPNSGDYFVFGQKRLRQRVRHPSHGSNLERQISKSTSDGHGSVGAQPTTPTNSMVEPSTPDDGIFQSSRFEPLMQPTTAEPRQQVIIFRYCISIVMSSF